MAILKKHRMNDDQRAELEGQIGMLPTLEEIWYVVNRLQRHLVEELLNGVTTIIERVPGAPDQATPPIRHGTVGEPTDSELVNTTVAVLVDAVERARSRILTPAAIRGLNGWFATVEEIVAAGDGLDEILSRGLKQGAPRGVGSKPGVSCSK